MQYSHTKTNTHMLPFKPSVQIPSGCESGQKIDRMEEIVKAMMPPMRRMAAGLTCQKNLGPVLALKSVKKSDTETLRYIAVVICVYSTAPMCSVWNTQLGS